MNRMTIAIATLALGAAPIAAQQPGTSAPPAVRDTGRAGLEGEIRERFARAVKQRVGLNDDQMTRLQQVSAKYEQQRRPLALEERSTRLQLRGIVVNEQAADQKQVDALLTKLVDIQKHRLQIVESEQKDLSGFMTPVQRVKFMAMREQLRRRVEQMRAAPGARGARGARGGAMRPGGAVRPIRPRGGKARRP